MVRKNIRRRVTKTRKCKGGWLALTSGDAPPKQSRTRVYVDPPPRKSYVYEEPLRSNVSEGQLVKKKKKSVVKKVDQWLRIQEARDKRDAQKREERREARRVAEISKLKKQEELATARYRKRLAESKAKSLSTGNRIISGLLKKKGKHSKITMF